MSVCCDTALAKAGCFMLILSRSGPRAVQGGGSSQRGRAEYVWQGVDAPDWILHSSACRDAGETSGTFCMCIDCCSLCVHAFVMLFQLPCSVGKGPIHFKPPIAKYICLSICPVSGLCSEDVFRTAQPFGTNWYCGRSSWARASCEKIWSLSSGSGSQ